MLRSVFMTLLGAAGAASGPVLQCGATAGNLYSGVLVEHAPAVNSAVESVNDSQQPCFDECPSSPSFCCCSPDGDALAWPVHHASPKPRLAAQLRASSLTCRTTAAAASTRLMLATRHADDLPAGSGACPGLCAPATGAACAPRPAAREGRSSEQRSGPTRADDSCRLDTPLSCSTTFSDPPRAHTWQLPTLNPPVGGLWRPQQCGKLCPALAERSSALELADRPSTVAPRPGLRDAAVAGGDAFLIRGSAPTRSPSCVVEGGIGSLHADSSNTVDPQACREESPLTFVPGRRLPVAILLSSLPLGTAAPRVTWGGRRGVSDLRVFATAALGVGLGANHRQLTVLISAALVVPVVAVELSSDEVPGTTAGLQGGAWVIASLLFMWGAARAATRRRRREQSTMVAPALRDEAWTPPCSPPHPEAAVFIAGPSSVGPAGPGNRGLFIAEASSVTAGDLHEVQAERLERFPSAEGTRREEWQQQCDARLEQLDAEGYYNFELWPADSLDNDELMVYEGPLPGAVPQLMSRQQIEAAGGSLRAGDCVVYALATPTSSSLNLANDAAYTPGCTEEDYEQRVRNGANHGDFVGGLDSNGEHTRTFVHFYRGAQPGEEVFLTYGWGFWAETAAAEATEAASRATGARGLRAEARSSAAASRRVPSLRTRGDRRDARRSLHAKRVEPIGSSGGLTLYLSDESPTGYCGVRATCLGTAFEARCWTSGKEVHLGCFETARAAAEAYARHALEHGLTPSGGFGAAARPVSEETRDEFIPTEEEAAELAELGHAGLKLWRRLDGKGSVAQGGTGFVAVSKRQNRKGGIWYYQAIGAGKRQIASSCKTAVAAAVAYALHMQSQAEAAQSSAPPSPPSSPPCAPSSAQPQPRGRRQTCTLRLRHFLLMLLPSLTACHPRGPCSAAAVAVYTEQSQSIAEGAWVAPVAAGLLLLWAFANLHGRCQGARWTCTAGRMPRQLLSLGIAFGWLMCEADATEPCDGRTNLHLSLEKLRVNVGLAALVSALVLANGYTAIRELVEGAGSPAAAPSGTCSPRTQSNGCRRPRQGKGTPYQRPPTGQRGSTSAAVSPGPSPRSAAQFWRSLRVEARRTMSGYELVEPPTPQHEVRNEGVPQHEVRKEGVPQHEVRDEGVLLPTTPDAVAAGALGTAGHKQAKRTARSRAYAERRSRQMQCLASAPTCAWRMLFWRGHLLNVIRRRACERRTAAVARLQSSAFVVAARERVAGRRKVLKLLGRPPRPICRDVGYDAGTGVFTYRDVSGTVTTRHPAAASGTTPVPAYRPDGTIIQPWLPSPASPIVLCPEASGAWCYYDSGYGTASWFPPIGTIGTTPLATRRVSPVSLPCAPPPRIPESIGLGNLGHTDWIAIHRDADFTVRLVHKLTGAVREAPWIVLRTTGGCPFFANLVSRETRWLPPPLWMESWISRRTFTADQYTPATIGSADACPYDCSRPMDARCPLPLLCGRERVEGGAPYLSESGRPQYEPDEYDTPLTYPLAEYRRSLRNNRWTLADATAMVGTECVGRHDEQPPPSPGLLPPPGLEHPSVPSHSPSLTGGPTPPPPLPPWPITSLGRVTAEAERGAALIARGWRWYAWSVSELGQLGCFPHTASLLVESGTDPEQKPPPFRFLLRDANGVPLCAPAPHLAAVLLQSAWRSLCEYGEDQQRVLGAWGPRSRDVGPRILKRSLDEHRERIWESAAFGRCWGAVHGTSTLTGGE
jgi:hypothetical protein